MAIDLIAERSAFDKWLMSSTQSLFSMPHRVDILAWSDVAARAYAPSLQTRAGELVRALQVGYPAESSATSMFRRVCYTVARGEGPAIAAHLAPVVARFPTHRAQLSMNMIANVLDLLFAGALLEHGAEVEASLGEPCIVFWLAGERIEPTALVDAAMKEDAAVAVLQGWAERLGASQSP